MWTLTDLKASHIDEIKSGKSGVETHISFSEIGTRKVALMRENLLKPVKTSKHIPHSLVIGLLFASKTSSVNSIVDVPIPIN